jgi:hypothetical protein
MESKSGTSAVLYGLTYSPTGVDTLEETRKGVPIHTGTAVGFETWAFKVRAKMTAIDAVEQKPEDKARKKSELASQLLDGLTGQALQCAMDIGHRDLIGRGGIDKLISDIKDMVRDAREDELTELVAFGSQKHGPLTRQRGEPMNVYLSRRGRWWARCKELDAEVHISENILVDYLLDGAHITDDQKRMIMTSVGNKKKLSDIHNALRKQHNRIHEN